MSQHDPFGSEKFEVYQSPEQTAFEPPERKPKGCLFWGCLIVAILFVVVVVLIVVGVILARNWAIGAVEQYTEPQPADLPVVEVDEERRTEIVSSWEDFKAALDEGRAAELSLDSDEFNIVAQEMVPKAAEHAYFTIEGDELNGQVSIPVDPFGAMIGTDRLDGRFFNASGTFDVTLSDGVLKIFMNEAEVKGEPIPKEAMQQISAQNLAENLMNNPENRDIISKLERVTVEDGRIIFVSKGDEDEDDEDEDEDTDDAEADADDVDDVPAPDAEATAPDEPEPIEAEPAAEPEIETESVPDAEPEEAEPAAETAPEPEGDTKAPAAEAPDASTPSAA